MIKIHDLDKRKSYPLQILSKQKSPVSCAATDYVCKEDNLQNANNCTIFCRWWDEDSMNYRSIYGKIKFESNYFSPNQTYIDFYSDRQLNNPLNSIRVETDKDWVADSAVIRNILDDQDPLSGLMSEYPNSFSKGIVADPGHLVITPDCTSLPL